MERVSSRHQRQQRALRVLVVEHLRKDPAQARVDRSDALRSGCKVYEVRSLDYVMCIAAHLHLVALGTGRIALPAHCVVADGHRDRLLEVECGVHNDVGAHEHLRQAGLASTR